MMKFRPQVESLSERINPSATLDTTGSYMPSTGEHVSSTRLDIPTDLLLQHTGLQSSNATVVGYTTHVYFTITGENPRIAEINKQLSDLAKQRTALADTLTTQVAVVKALVVAWNTANDELRAEFQRLRDAGYSDAQINNFQSIISLWKVVDKLTIQLDIAEKQVRDTIQSIKLIDVQVNALYQELIALGEAESAKNPQ